MTEALGWAAVAAACLAGYVGFMCGYYVGRDRRREEQPRAKNEASSD